MSQLSLLGVRTLHSPFREAPTGIVSIKVFYDPISILDPTKEIRLYVSTQFVWSKGDDLSSFPWDIEAKKVVRGAGQQVVEGKFIDTVVFYVNPVDGICYFNKKGFEFPGKSQIISMIKEMFQKLLK